MVVFAFAAVCAVYAAAAAAQLTPSPTYSPPSATQGTVSSTASPNPQWAAVLGNGLWFYDAQRSGNLSQGIGNRVEWRNDSALNDGQDYGLDLSGGWYDAGDYIKHIFPLGFTMFALSWGALSYGPGYEAAKQTAYLDSTLRWGYDWMIKAHPSDSVLFVQVGSSDVDNGYWGGDLDIPNPRPAYPINATAPGTDAWMSTAAAMALGALAYSGQQWNTSASAYTPAPIKDEAYSSTLLKHAVALYDTANSTDKVSYTKSAPGAAAAYASSGWGDDMCTAALALAAATGDSKYYADAVSFYSQYKLSSSRSVWNWDARTPAAFVMFAELAAARPNLATGAGLDPNITGWQNQAEGYFDAIVNGNVKGAYLTRGGLLYYSGDSDEASLNPALAAATLMLRYAPLASTSDKRDAYVKFALGQLDYAMGNNPANAVYMVGIHPNSPQNPHSGLASGGTDINNIRTSPEKEAHVLYGAVVGGPRPSDLFWDWRDDWVQTEIALDYNANIPALAAYQLVTNASDPHYVQVAPGSYSIPQGEPCDAALQCGGGLSGGAIAGIVIGVVAGVAILAGVAWWKRDWFRGRR